LFLTDLYDPIPGGGYYYMKQCENKEVNKDLWLCDITRFVFRNIPEKIYIRNM
jgi:hypothetical protein